MLRYAGDRFVGTSSDTKPLNVLDGAVFFESDTRRLYLKEAGVWVEVVRERGRLFVTRDLPAVGQYIDLGYFSQPCVAGRLEVTVPAFGLARVYSLTLTGPFEWREVVPELDYRTVAGEIALDAAGDNSSVYLRLRRVAGSGDATALVVLTHDPAVTFVPTENSGMVIPPGRWFDARWDARPVPISVVYGTAGEVLEIQWEDGRRQQAVYNGEFLTEMRYYRGQVFLYKYVYTYDSEGNLFTVTYSAEE